MRKIFGLYRHGLALRFLTRKRQLGCIHGLMKSSTLHKSMNPGCFEMVPVH